MKIIQKLFMHSLTYDACTPCQIFVPSTAAPWMLVGIFVLLWIREGWEDCRRRGLTQQSPGRDPHLECDICGTGSPLDTALWKDALLLL